MDGLQNLDYPERLRYLDLPTLQYRRHRGDMIEIWKHFNIYKAEILTESFQHLFRPSRQHSRHLFQHRPSDGTFGVQSISFYSRTIKMWNGLPSKAAEAGSLNLFKNYLDDHWFDPSVPPPHPSYSVSSMSAA